MWSLFFSNHQNTESAVQSCDVASDSSSEIGSNGSALEDDVHSQWSDGGDEGKHSLQHELTPPQTPHSPAEIVPPPPHCSPHFFPNWDVSSHLIVSPRQKRQHEHFTGQSANCPHGGDNGEPQQDTKHLTRDTIQSQKAQISSLLSQNDILMQQNTNLQRQLSQKECQLRLYISQVERMKFGQRRVSSRLSRMARQMERIKERIGEPKLICMRSQLDKLEEAMGECALSPLSSAAASLDQSDQEENDGCISIESLQSNKRVRMVLKKRPMHSETREEWDVSSQNALSSPSSSSSPNPSISVDFFDPMHCEVDDDEFDKCLKRIQE